MRLCWNFIYRIDFAVHGLALLASPIIGMGDPSDLLRAIVAVGLYKRIKCYIVHELGVRCS